MSRKIVAACTLMAALFAAANAGAREILISGNTMGTTYHIKVAAGLMDRAGPLEKAIAGRLAAINRSMSTYLEDSEISRFNRIDAAGEKFFPGPDFLHVLGVARDLFGLTGGAWDGTVKPLVDLWGFGSGRAPAGIPAADAIDALRGQVGFDRLDMSADGFLVKKYPRVTLDLASIAKGFAVDAVAEVIRRSGFENFLVEIGGEVYAAGSRPDGGRWRVGINRPAADAPLDAVYRVVELQDRGFATSGDYRNFFEHEGRRYSHVIDPRTGRPTWPRCGSPGTGPSGRSTPSAASSASWPTSTGRVTRT